MKFYIIGSLIKIIIWSIILFLTNKNINPQEDFLFWLIFIILWLFLVFWWISFWIFIFVNKFLFKQHNRLSISYKSSLILGIFIIINLLFIIFDLWDKITWILLVITFILINYFIIKDEKNW